MKTSHTPGPWVAVCNNWEVSTIYADGALPVAECHFLGEVSEESEGIVPDVKDANARLIAAAPDLLEALQIAKNSLVSFKFVPGQSNMWEDHDEANLEAVNEAIAKATGEENEKVEVPTAAD